MAKKIVTLYIDDTCLRLLVTRGKRIKNWADLPLEPGLVKSGVVIKEAEVAAKIKQLLQAQKVKAKKVIVGLSGLHCLTRPITLPQLPNAMLDEAVTREARRVLPVPLEQLFISWQIIPAPEGKTQVFLVAVPRKTADALFQMLRQAELKPYLMDLKPMVLARVVREETAIIVDIQPTEFDIVIMARGVPQPIRTMSLPSKAQSWQKKLPTIRDEIDKTIKFYDSTNPETPLVSSVPIFVSGELADEPELCQSLSDELGHPVLPLSSPLDCPEQLDPNRYMVNIGLMLKELSPGKEVGPLVANINALPAAYQPKPLSLTKVIALPGAIVLIGLLVPLIMLIQDASADMGPLRSQLDTTNQLIGQRLSQRQELVGNIAELEKKLAEAEASRDNFAAALGGIENLNEKANGDLKIAIDSLPSTIDLIRIGHVDNILTINGVALSEAEVLAYLKHLDESGRFSEVTIASLRKTADNTDFTLVLKSGGRA
jgi:type IV pilus assembly protein PilM